MASRDQNRALALEGLDFVDNEESASTLPLRVKFGNSKFCSKEEVEQTLQPIIEQLAHVAYVSFNPDVDITFYHPYGMHEFLKDREHLREHLEEDDDSSDKLSISLEGRADCEHIWLAGFPDICDEHDSHDLNTMYEDILGQFETDVLSSNFKFVLEIDAKRREILLTPDHKPVVLEKWQKEGRYPKEVEKKADIEDAIYKILLNKIILAKYKEKHYNLIQRGATKEFARMWQTRRNRTTVSKFEQAAMEWTDRHVIGNEELELDTLIVDAAESVMTTSASRDEEDSMGCLGSDLNDLEVIDHDNLQDTEAREELAASSTFIPSPEEQQQPTASRIVNDHSDVVVASEIRVREDASDEQETNGSERENNKQKKRKIQGQIGSMFKKRRIMIPVNSSSMKTRSSASCKVRRSSRSRSSIELRSEDSTKHRSCPMVVARSLSTVLPKPHPFFAKTTPEKRRRAWNNDKEVHKAFKEVIREKRNNGKFVPTSSTLSPLDEQQIKARLKANCFTEEKKSENSTTTIDEFLIENYPYLTPRNYNKIDEKEDFKGLLKFIDASTKKKGQTDVKMPEYTFTEKNFYFNGNKKQEDAERKIFQSGILFTQCCHCKDGCKPETCECMQSSALKNGLVDKSTGNDNVVECSKDCACYVEGEDHSCPSIINYKKFKFHCVYTTNMGYCIRVMENIKRGEMLAPLTGELMTKYPKEEGCWVMDTINCKEVDKRNFTGIQDKSLSFSINTCRHGNLSRFFCHSEWENCSNIRVYRGGIRTTEPDIGIYAVDDLEAGDLLFINYGRTFHFKRKDCHCTQELCHSEEIRKWMKKLSWIQAYTFLENIELQKRARMIERENRILKELETEEALLLRKGKSRR